MKMIWHIMKKDFRAIWLLWLVWLGLIAVRIPWLVFYLTAANERAVKFIELMSVFAFVADILLVFMVVGRLVHEDPLPSDKAFWVTRPVGAGELCLAKTFTSLVVCVLSPLVFLVPTWMIFGVDAVNIGKLLGYHGALNGGVMLIAMLFAVVTRKAATYAMLGLVALAAVGLIATTVESGLEIKVARRAVVYWPVLGTGICFCIFAIVQQYLTRNTRRTWCLLGVLVVSAGLVLPSSSGKRMFRNRGELAPSALAVRAEWKDQKLTLATKPEGTVIGAIQVVSDSQFGRIRLKYLAGKWVGPNGISESALLVADEHFDGGFSWIDPRAIDFGAKEKVYRFPAKLSMPSNVAGWSTVGFDGRVGIQGMKDVKVAELPLVVGARVAANGFRARLLKVGNYEKVVEAVFLQVTAPSVEAGRNAIVNTDPGKKWNMRSASYTGAGMLLWLELRRKTFTAGKLVVPLPPDMWRGNYGPEIQEALAEQGWRIEWRQFEPVFYKECELRAERLEIAKE